MPRLLLIDPDRDGLDGLHAALRRAGFDDVTTVTSGAFALTTIERNRPDLIVSRAGVSDIDGYELCAIVRNDPSLTGVLFLLLEGPGDHAPAPRHEDKPDQVLAGDLPLATIVSAVAALLQQDDEPAAASAAVVETEPSALAAPVEIAKVAEATPLAEATPVAEAAAADETPTPGAFDLMKLAEAMQEVVVGQKTGHLVLTLRSGRGVIVFERGKVVHSEFFGLIGETAFAALLVAAHGEAQGSFAFEALTTLPANAMRTINRDLKQLLMSAAIGIDEGRTGAAVAPVS